MKTYFTKNTLGWILIISLAIGIVSCKDSKDEVTSYDPTIPVEVSSFFPEQGKSGSQLLIHGVNFGSDTSQVKVTINDKEAVLVNVSNSMIYCLVPPHAGSGLIKVKIGTTTNEQEAISPSEFEYIPSPVVKTLSGWVDKDGNSSITDGTFEQAQFEAPYWMISGDDNSIYLLEQERGLRKISFDNRRVTTLFRTGNGLGKPRAISFSPDYSNMYIFNDQESTEGLGVAIAPRSSNYATWSIMAKSESCCGGDCNPVTGDVYFNRWNGGEFYKWNFDTKVKDFVFRVDNGFNSTLQFAPSGKFAYIITMSHHCVYKVDYDFATGKLGGLRILCGKKSNWDQGAYADGPGTKARFNNPQQGVFDENDNFYLCDAGNHCIRKIEPNGQVTTYAGRPGEWGYTDGDLRKEARFHWPHGIAYNKETKEFYIADKDNKRIRIITQE